MLKTLIKKELLQQIQTQKFIISTAISLVLMLLAVHISTEQYEKKLELYRQATTGQQKELERLKATKRGENAYAKSEMIYRKPTPLSIFCQGKENSFGGAASVGGYFARPIGNMDDNNEYDFQEVMQKTFGEIDVILVIKLLFSLMAIFLAFDLVTREREQETLKLIHSNQVSRFKVISAKWLAGVLILSVILLLGFIFSLLYLQLVPKIIFEKVELFRLFLLFSVSLIYLLIFFQTALLFSCIVRSSQLSLVCLFLIWAFSIFIIPNLATISGKYLSPVPPMDYVFDNRSVDDEKVRAVNQHFINQLQAQRQKIVSFSYLSPSAVFEFAAEFLASTSVADYDRFMNQVHFISEKWREIQLHSHSEEIVGESKIFKIIKLDFSDLKKDNIQKVTLLFNGSIDNNRLPLKIGLVRAIPLAGWFIILNCLLFLFIVWYYERHTKIVRE